MTSSHPPSAVDRNGSVHPHREADERSLVLHREVARRVLADEEILDAARSRVEAWLEDGGPVPRPLALGWRALLELPVAELAGRLVEASEQMADLRQCSPFAGAIPPRRRWELLRESGDGANPVTPPEVDPR